MPKNVKVTAKGENIQIIEKLFEDFLYLMASDMSGIYNFEVYMKCEE